MSKDSLHKLKMYTIICVMLLSIYLPLLPTTLFTANAAGLTPDESTVDSSIPLDVSPHLISNIKWYYDGVTPVKNSATGATLGSVYRYISENGDTRNLVKGTDATVWANTLSEDANFVFRKFEDSSQRYLFSPPASTNKSSFDLYLFADFLNAAGITYASTGSEIIITKPSAPKITDFKVKETPNANGKYALYSTITIQFTVEEYLEKHDTLRNIQVYGQHEGETPFKIGEVATANTTNGAYTGEVTYKIASNGDLTLFMRAYDAANQLDQDSKNGESVASFGTFYKMPNKISSELDITQDGQPIPMYDYSAGTQLRSVDLANGLLGRQNGKMRQYPSGNIGWFGKVRYPTVWLGNPDDGGVKATTNSNFAAEGREGQMHTVTAYPKSFMYIVGPINPAVAQPDTKIHDSVTTSTFTLQEASRFNESDVKKLFNGNPEHVLNLTPKHKIITETGQDLGQYYWLRELAEYSGGDVNNTCIAENDTCLNVIQTPYPQIDKFELKSTNDYSVANKAISFNFEGYEYVSDSRTGTSRNQVEWELEIVSSPSQAQDGEKVTGTSFSNKLAENPSKPAMKKYDGKYTSTHLAKITPKQEGTYTVRLTVTDQVKRSATSSLISFKIGDGGGSTPTEFLTITPPSHTTNVGGTVKYEAYVQRETGQQKVTNLGVWTIADENIGTNGTKGMFTGKAKGTTTVTIEYNGMTASAELIVGDGDGTPLEKGLVVKPPHQTVWVGSSESYKAYYTDDNGVTTDVTQESNWSTSGGFLVAETMNARGHFRGNKVGETNVVAKYNGMTAEAILEVIANPFVPPTAIIKAPTTIEVGETFCLDGRDSYDTDGEIVAYYWTAHGMKNDDEIDFEEQSAFQCNNYYTELGEKTVVLQVDDDEGNWGYTEHKITVTPPQPSASFNVSGHLIENRHVKIQPNGIYKDDTNFTRFPIVKHTWTITPKSGVTTNDYRTRQTVNSGQHFASYNQVIDFLSKKAGTYEVTRYVESNIGLSDTVTKTVVIKEDLQPVANFDVHASIMYRDEYKNAVLKATDKSNATDDIIGKRIWTVYYDSDNDGSFADETVLTRNDGNTTNFNYSVNKVGKYLIELEIFDEFNEPTLAEFVNLTFNKNVTDRRNHNTDSKAVATKVIEIDNVQPFSSFEASPIKEINVEIDLADSPYTQSDVLNVLPYFNQLLRAGNLKAHVSFAERQNVSYYGIKAKGSILQNGTNYGTKDMLVKVERNKVSYSVIRTENNNTNFSTFTFPYNIQQTLVNDNNILFLLENGSVYILGNQFYMEYESDFSGYLKNITTMRIATPTVVELPRIKKMYKKENLSFFEDFGGKFHIRGHFSGGYQGDAYDVSNTILSEFNHYANNFSGIFEPVSAQNFRPKYMMVENYWVNALSYFIPYTKTTANNDFWFIRNSTQVHPFANETTEQNVIPINASNINQHLGGVANLNIITEPIVRIEKDTMGEKYWYTYENSSGNIRYARREGTHVITESGKAYFVNPQTNRLESDYHQIEQFTKFKAFDNKTFSVKMTNKLVNANSLITDLTGVSTTFIGMGTTLNQAALNTVKNAKGGKVVNLSIPKNTNTNMNTLANAILELYAQEFGTNDVYVVLGEEMNYITTQDDPENDPIVKSRWKFKHNEKVFANDLGRDPINNQYIDQPIYQLSKTGLYNPIFTVLDNPLANINVALHGAFSKYPKWSDETNSVNIYVHRKPVPEFSYTLNSSTGYYTIQNKAYDLDLCGSTPGNAKCGYGTGIKTQKWNWRYFGEIAWRNGLPANNLEIGKIYEIKNTVTDYQGRTEFLIKELSTISAPPVAMFEPIPATIYEGDSTLLLNMSSEPNGQKMTSSWKYREKGSSTWITTGIPTGSYMNGAGNATWSPNTSVFATEGIYEVMLTVVDEDGLSDSMVQEVEVLKKPTLLEMGLRELEVFTAPASQGLPVYLQLNEKMLTNSVDGARDIPIQVDVYRNGQLYQSNAAPIKNFLDGLMFVILPKNSSSFAKDTAYTFEFVLRSLDERILIDEAAKKISVTARTAAEKTVVPTSFDYKYEGLLSVKRSIGTAQVNTYETIRVKTKELQPTVTGFGHEVDQEFTYELPKNQHYKASAQVFMPTSQLKFDARLIDSHFNGAAISNAGVATLNTVRKDFVNTLTATKETTKVTQAYPKVYVEKNTGHVFSQMQKDGNDGRIQQPLLDGGHKLYVPIWLDEIGDYAINYTTNAMGVNKVIFAFEQDLELEGYMFLHMNSDTKDKDKWLMEPVNKKNPFPQGKPADWTNQEVEWLKK